MDEELRKELSVKWNSLGSSDQCAVDYILDLIEDDAHDISKLPDEELKDYADRGCSHIDNGNAETEYEDEEFYDDECDRYKVLEYLKLKRAFEKSNQIMTKKRVLLYGR